MASPAAARSPRPKGGAPESHTHGAPTPQLHREVRCSVAVWRTMTSVLSCSVSSAGGTPRSNRPTTPAVATPGAQKRLSPGRHRRRSAYRVWSHSTCSCARHTHGAQTLHYSTQTQQCTEAEGAPRCGYRIVPCTCVGRARSFSRGVTAGAPERSPEPLHWCTPVRPPVAHSGAVSERGS